MFKVGDKVIALWDTSYVKQGVEYTISDILDGERLVLRFVNASQASLIFKLKESVVPEQTKIPHKHAELIKAWADGAEIQTRHGKEWKDCDPQWFVDCYYRIKPQKVKRKLWFVVKMNTRSGNIYTGGSYDSYADASAEFNGGISRLEWVKYLTVQEIEIEVEV